MKRGISIFGFLFLFVIGIVSAAGINPYYKLDLNYDKGDFSLISNDVELSLEEHNNYFGNYTVSVFDYKGKINDIYFFDVPNLVLYDEVDENGTIIGGGEMILEDVNFTIYIPYFENATKIIIYDENVSKMLEIDISAYSKTYDEYKKFESSNGSVEEENIDNEENIEEEESIEEETFIEKASKYWWVLLVVLLILLVVLVVSITKSK